MKALEMTLVRYTLWPLRKLELPVYYLGFYILFSIAEQFRVNQVKEFSSREFYQYVLIPIFERIV